MNRGKNDFIRRFSNRIETIGKDGIVGILKNTNIPINSKISYIPSNKRYFNQDSTINSYNIASKNSPRTVNPPYAMTIDKSMPLIMPSIVINEANRITLPQIRNNNIREVRGNENCIDHGYTPYTLKDYKGLPKEVKLGGLGPNIGGEEWKKLAKRRIKMSMYGENIIKEKKGICGKKGPSANELIEREKEQMILNSKWSKVNEYSGNIEEKNNIGNIFQREVNSLFEKKDKEEKRNNLELYQIKLDNLRKSLIW